MSKFSKEVLETDDPICPYAKKTWESDRVDVVLSKCKYWSDFVEISQGFQVLMMYCD